PLAHAMLALVDEGDEVLIPTPYWLSYPEQVTLAGGTVRWVQTRAEDGFHLDGAAVDAAAGPESKELVLHFPNNPEVALLDEARLKDIADVCIRRDLLVLSDEIYGALVYGGATHRSIAAVRPEMRERTIVCHGLSKSYAMTGWRLGFALAPREILAAMAKIQ